MSNKTNPMDVRTDFDRYKERHQKTPTEPIRSTSLKAIIIGACVLVVAALIVIPIIISATRTRHLALPEKINKITIYKEGTAGTTFSYTDSEKIGKLTDYLTSLKLKPVAGINEKEGILLGGEWEIKMDSEGSVSGVNLFGNEFVQDPEGEWWVISSKGKPDFEELLRSQIPDEMPQTPLFDEWAAASLATRELMQNVSSKARSFMEIP